MQGTIAMLVALSGMGCHHKSCEYAPVASCYSSCHSSCYSSGYSSCYSSGSMTSYSVMPSSQSYMPSSQSYGSCYSSCYSGSSSCYSSGYSSCYDSCYSSGHHGHKKGGGLFARMFGHKNRSACAAPVETACSSCDLGVYNACYSMPVYGSYTPVYTTNYGSGQTYGAPQGGSMVSPQESMMSSPAMSSPAMGDTAPPPTPNSLAPPEVPMPETTPPPPSPPGSSPDGLEGPQF